MRRDFAVSGEKRVTEWRNDERNPSCRRTVGFSETSTTWWTSAIPALSRLPHIRLKGPARDVCGHTHATRASVASARCSPERPPRGRGVRSRPSAV